jgi:L-ascorbate metabolism protein UlaG (beta-lactamase superfamily)
MGEVVDMAETFGPITPEKVLKAAMSSDLKEVIVVGETKDGTVYLSASTGEPRNIMWFLSAAKKLTMDAAFVEVEE